MQFVRLFLYRGSFLVFPFILLMLYLLHSQKKKRIWLFLFMWSLVFVWARFIEPQLIHIQETKIDVWITKTVVLIADFHMGVYKRPDFLARVVSEINNLQDIDFVLIAWDFADNPLSSDVLIDLYAALWQIEAPTYAVLWNHDVEKPGPPLRDELVAALWSLWVTLLNNDVVSFPSFDLIGLGAHLNAEDQISILWDYTSKPSLVLTHNPDTTLAYDKTNNADLTLVWHTHCWQVKIPGLYQQLIPTRWSFVGGKYEWEYGDLFITCGLWETGLPLRLFNPPTIDILHLY